VTDLGNDLRAYLDASPSPYHAVAESVRRLEAVGFAPLDERERWSLSPGARHYVVRDGGSLIAFRVGSAPLADAGVRLIGTHTDSPTFRVRPRSDVTRAGSSCGTGPCSSSASRARPCGSPRLPSTSTAG
jgi:aspartyl aminopeptidase